MQSLTIPSSPLVKAELVPAALNRIAFSAENDLVATGNTAMEVTVHHKGHPLMIFDLQGFAAKAKRVERMRGLAFDPSGEFLFVATSEVLVAFHLPSRTQAWRFDPPRNMVFLIQGPTSLSVTRWGNILAPFEDGSVGVWSSTGAQLAYRKGISGPRLAAWTPDGMRFVGSDMQGCYVYDAQTFEKTLSLPIDSRVLAMAMNPNEDYVALRTLDQVSVVSIETGAELFVAPAGVGLPLIAMSPAARLVAVGDRNGASLLDAAGMLRRRIDMDGARLTSMAFSPDGNLLAMGGSDGRLRFHALRTMVDAP